MGAMVDPLTTLFVDCVFNMDPCTFRNSFLICLVETVEVQVLKILVDSISIYYDQELGEFWTSTLIDYNDFLSIGVKSLSQEVEDEVPPPTHSHFAKWLHLIIWMVQGLCCSLYIMITPRTDNIIGHFHVGFRTCSNHITHIAGHDTHSTTRI